MNLVLFFYFNYEFFTVIQTYFWIITLNYYHVLLENQELYFAIDIRSRM